MMLSGRTPQKIQAFPLRLRRRRLASYSQAGCIFMFLIPHMAFGVLFPLSIIVHHYVRWHGMPIVVIVDVGIGQKVRLSRYNYEMAKEGDQVTVFYDPGHPGRCLVYDYCEYEYRTEGS